MIKPTFRKCAECQKIKYCFKFEELSDSPNPSDWFFCKDCIAKKLQNIIDKFRIEEIVRYNKFLTSIELEIVERQERRVKINERLIELNKKEGE